MGWQRARPNRKMIRETKRKRMLRVVKLLRIRGRRSYRRLRDFNVALPSFLLLVGFVLATRAHASGAETSRGPNRCLFIVETSRAMQRRVGGTVETIERLLGSGLQQQLRRGDSIGVWTYSQTLRAGEFPLQQWSDDAVNAIISRISEHVRTQRFEKISSFESVRAPLRDLIRESPRILCVIISSGETPVSGTPFDDEIAHVFAKWKAEQERARMPFVTMLSAANGKVVGHAIAPAPWPIQVPQLPAATKPLARAASNSSPVPAATNRPFASKVPPLIISGKAC
jgi:hypothetical protein